jgi:hypothetical protein
MLELGLCWSPTFRFSLLNFKVPGTVRFQGSPSRVRDSSPSRLSLNLRCAHSPTSANVYFQIFAPVGLAMLLCVELLVGPDQASVSAHVIAVCCISLINLPSQTYLGAQTITMIEERARRVKGPRSGSATRRHERIPRVITIQFKVQQLPKMIKKKDPGHLARREPSSRASKLLREIYFNRTQL